MNVRLYQIALLVLPALLVLSPIPPATADDLLDVANGTAPEIIRVRAFGKWTESELSGVYRGLLVRRPPQAGKPVAVRFYLQWLALSADGKLSLLRTIEFPKLAEAGTNVTDFRNEKDPEGLIMFLDTRHPTTKDDTTYELFLRAFDDYDLQPASN